MLLGDMASDQETLKSLQECAAVHRLVEVEIVVGRLLKIRARGSVTSL